ncbi:Integrase [Variovorax sp. YR752]|uniref:tyrosine-type recombinase/integrase n=1 Tax=Variovorax sp. YR752 TaxID=1884383 RepID=UPI000BDBAE01|nr:integrase arm-type DNA-binding domain-containing protein [Variovorax sp. YR752]SOD25373.1 Integrase [Variovorax sp. YR752]
MARELNRLTALEIKNAQPSSTPNTPRLIADGGGLYLQVTPQGSKSFLFRYTYNGKPQTLGLGSVNSLNLAGARELAQQHRSLVQKGMDPKIERVREKTRRDTAAEQTFQWCADEYIEAHKEDWKNEKHINQWRQSIKDYANPHIGLLPVKDINEKAVMAVLDPIWRTKTETATRLRGRIERILGWATVIGYRSGDNPARWTAHLSELLPKPSKVAKVEHHPAVDHRKIAQFLRDMHMQKDGMGIRALEFLTLTASRTGEVIGAQWDEFDLEGKVWTVPAERMKGQRIHEVPLSQRAVEIIKNIAHLPDEKYVFRGTKHGTHISNMTMLNVMRRMGLEAVPHGMRSTFRDWAADETDFPRELAEAALAHIVGDKTEAAYLRTTRLDRRRVMMDAWAEYCARPKAVAAGAQDTKK